MIIYDLVNFFVEKISPDPVLREKLIEKLNECDIYGVVPKNLKFKLLDDWKLSFGSLKFRGELLDQERKTTFTYEVDFSNPRADKRYRSIYRVKNSDLVFLFPIIFNL